MLSLLAKMVVFLQLSFSVRVSALSVHLTKSNSMLTQLCMKNENAHHATRSKFLKQSILPIISISSTLNNPALAVERAVGAAEKSCREAGNCLENFDIDGAVGWNWGGRDRCDATDPLCGPDGKIRDSPLQGDPKPQPLDKDGSPIKITTVVEINLSIGKSEKGTLTVGLYGEACPNSVSQVLSFLDEGIVTTPKLMLENGFGVSTAPVSLQNGGAITLIYPSSRIDFGIMSQATSYAKAFRLNKIPDNFLPQPRPNPELVSKENSPRTHTVPGLLSIPKNGLGFGGNGFENEDEAFVSAFELTAGNVPSMDKDQRKVIGQLMNESSMQLLARLSSLPTKKGLKGVIPGQNAGPPLLKTNVLSAALSSSENTKILTDSSLDN